MTRLHQFIFCLIFISNTLHTQTPEQQYNSHNKQSAKPKKLSCPKESESFFSRLGRLGKELGIYKDITSPDISEFDNNNIAESDSSEFHNDDIAELEMVFESSPEEAQQIVSYLKNNNAYKKKRGYIVFVGKPGVGKTTMAKAIAYKMSLEGWGCQHFTSSDFIKSNRNQTGMYLKQKLEAAAFSFRPTIVIIDEINGLLENTHSENHDTDSTSKALWSFLDEQKNNPQFFLIGTANDISKLPQALQNRLMGRIIEFPTITSMESRIKSLRGNLIQAGLKFDKEITDAFLESELKKISDHSSRSIDRLAESIYFNNQANSSLMITKEIITKNILKRIEEEKTMGYNVKKETDAERQERYHQENKSEQNSYILKQAGVQTAVHIGLNYALPVIISFITGGRIPPTTPPTVPPFY